MFIVSCSLTNTISHHHGSNRPRSLAHRSCPIFPCLRASRLRGQLVEFHKCARVCICVCICVRICRLAVPFLNVLLVPPKCLSHHSTTFLSKIFFFSFFLLSFPSFSSSIWFSTVCNDSVVPLCCIVVFRSKRILKSRVARREN